MACLEKGGGCPLVFSELDLTLYQMNYLGRVWGSNGC